MVRFILLLTFKSETASAERGRVVQQIGEMPRHFEQIRSWQVNVNCFDELTRYTDVAVIGDFVTLDDFKRFMNDPEHKAIGARMAPSLAEVSRCVFELTSD